MATPQEPFDPAGCVQHAAPTTQRLVMALLTDCHSLASGPTNGGIVIEPFSILAPSSPHSSACFEYIRQVFTSAYVNFFDRLGFFDNITDEERRQVVLELTCGIDSTVAQALRVVSRKNLPYSQPSEN